jgi:hypothetical protein
MYVAERLVFLQLQKTGCTHIAKLLSKLVPGRQMAKHSRAPAGLIDGSRAVVGSVRDPWDWYVSLWAFGCGRQGALYELLAGGDSARHAAWRRVYADSGDPALFRQWLAMISETRFLGERYGASSIRAFAGFYTYRYCRLFARDDGALFSGAIADAAALADFDRRQNVVGHFIRNEHLAEDLIQVLGLCGYRLDAQQLELIGAPARTNASARDRDHARYYDDRSVRLVLERERFIVDKHGYAAPAIRVS